MPRFQMWNVLLVSFLQLGMLCSACEAQKKAKRNRPYPPTLPGAQVEVYKKVGDVELKVFIYNPPGHQPSDKRPAIVFFFGGGWRAGSPAQFKEHCEHLASRGMVAMTADYRVSSRHDVKAIDCVRDAKSAIRWVRKESGRLGLDPERVAAGGGSAGGHLAAATAFVPEVDDQSDDLSVSPKPNALVLFNPAVVLAAVEGIGGREGIADELKERMGTDPKNLSPYHHVKEGGPPTIIFHGKADSTVSYRSVEAFTAAMKKVGNQCELVGYDDQQHGFFNFGRGGNEYYRQTLQKTDEFLTKLGYLDPQKKN